MTDYNVIHDNFSVNGVGVVCRGDYENLPCPLYATEFDDAKMMYLAHLIYDTLVFQYGFNECDVKKYFSNEELQISLDNIIFEDIDNAFWREMEEIAVSLGMRYYEDMTDEEYNKIKMKN